MSGLRPMDLCRLQVSELVNPSTSFHVSRVFCPPLAIIAFRSFRVKIVKIFVEWSIPSRPRGKAMLSRKNSLFENLWLYIRILVQS